MAAQEAGGSVEAGWARRARGRRRALIAGRASPLLRQRRNCARTASGSSPSVSQTTANANGDRELVAVTQCSASERTRGWSLR